MAQNRACSRAILHSAIIVLGALFLSTTAFAESAAESLVSTADTQQSKTSPMVYPRDIAGTRSSPNGTIVLTASQLVDVQRRAKNGEAKAQYILGAAYRGGGTPLKQDDAAALNWFRKAADQGSAEAQRELGNAYARG